MKILQSQFVCVWSVDTSETLAQAWGGQGAVTPGNFVLYPRGGSSKPYYSTHEPRHVLQYRILGPVLYYAVIAIPSIMHANHPDADEHYHEKSANTLWYLYTGEHDDTNPRYFFDK